MSTCLSCSRHQIWCLQLPCAQLQQLSSLTLHGHALELQAVAGAAATRLPKLQCLTVAQCRLSSTSTLLQLTSLCSVTQLELNSISGVNFLSVQGAKELSAAVGALFRHLTQLAKVELAAVPLDDESLWQSISGATSLRDLSISASGLEPGTQLRLPSSLTRLDVTGGDGGYFADAPTTPKVLPPALQQLSLQNVNIRPHISTTDLGVLSLHECRLLAAGEEQLGGWERLKGADAAAAAVFLAAVARMPKLEQIIITDCHSFSVLSELPPQHFAALACSSQLQKLQVRDNRLRLPTGAISHMMHQGTKQLQHLHHFSLVGQQASDPADDDVNMSAEDVRALVRSCPNLAQLELRHVLQPGALAPLRELPTQCCNLILGGLAIDDDAVATLCQLSHLTSLELHDSPTLTDHGLESLTVLTSLSHFGLSDCTGVSNAVYEPFANQRGWSSLCLPHENFRLETPVWQQLCAVCDRSNVLAPSRLKVQIAHLQERNAQLQERVEGMADRLVQFEQLSEEIKQQLE